MRILISIILISIFTDQTYSQKKIVTYYDKLWRLTTKDFAEYSRISYIDTVKYQYTGEVKDFYINGSLQMKGKYQNNVKVDRFLFYYPNGNLMTNGFYKDNSRWGIWTNYYENGNVRDKIAFNKDFLGALEYYNENGDTIIKNGTGLWQTQFLNDFTYRIGLVKGEFKDSLRHGNWNYYTISLTPEVDEEPRLECTEIYENGRFISGKYYWGGGHIQDIYSPVMTIFPESVKFENTETWQKTPYASKNEYPVLRFLPELDSTLLPVDIYARFPGGFDSLITTFNEKIKLPKSLIKADKTLACSFGVLISKTGKLKIIEDPNQVALIISPAKKPFYVQVKKILKNLPDWEPAKRDNKNVSNHFDFRIIMEDGSIKISISTPNRQNPIKNLFPMASYGSSIKNNNNL